MTVAALKAELAEYGVDPEGLCEKEELVQVLCAVRASKVEAAAAAEEKAAAKAAATAAARGAGGGDAGTGGPRVGPSFPQAPQPPPRTGPSSQSWSLPTVELQGRWFRNNGATIIISNDVVTFSNGATAKLLPTGPMIFCMLFDGRNHQGRLSGMNIAWSDGDVWTRTGGTRPNGPERPKAGSGPRAGELPQRGGHSRAQALACLELAGNPSQDEIRKAYKKAALRWHPDRRQNHDKAEEAKERFQEVRAAFEFLQT